MVRYSGESDECGCEQCREIDVPEWSGRLDQAAG